MSKPSKYTILFLTFGAFCLSLFLFRSDSGAGQKEGEGISKQSRIDKAIEQEFEMTKDLSTETVPRERLIRARSIVQNKFSGNRTANILWEERGPNNVGGRTRALLFDANDNTGKTVWAGGVGGGLWKTTDIDAADPNWASVNDFFENVAVSCIAQDPANTQNIYFGTGEGWYNIDAMRGLGIWKTDDGGATWNQLPSTNNGDFRYVQKIAITSAGVLFAATRDDGIMRSLNGGTSWTKVLGANGAGADTNRGADIEIAADGDIYVTMGVFGTDGIYRSTDGGNNWSIIISGLPAAENYERIEIACAPSNANRLYALLQHATDNNCLGIFRSDNGGNSWIEVDNPSAIGMSTFTRNQAWYDLIAQVDPNDDDRVYIGGVDLLVSDNAGTSWTQVSQWYGGSGLPYVHADQHAIVFYPGSSSRILFGNDGGVFLTNNGNASQPAFAGKNTGYNVTQFYACAMHPDAGVNYYLAGAQDNGTQRYNQAGVNSTDEVTGGDGAFCHIDQDEPNIQISSYVYNQYRITTNSWGNFNSVNVSSSDGRFINPTDYDDANNTLYGASEDNEYTRIQNVGTSNDDEIITISEFGGGQVSTVTVGQTANRVFFGLGNGEVVRVDNAHTASPTATVIRTGSGYVSSVALQNGNEDHILVTYSNYGRTSVYESVNGGNSWTDVEGDLPDFPVRGAIFSPSNPDQALLATELGAWFTEDLDGGNTEWLPTSIGLANTRIDQLQYRSSDNQVIAATHGRGLFSTNFFSAPQVNFATAAITHGEELADLVTATCRSYKEIQVPVRFSPLPPTSVTVDITVDMAETTATAGRDYELMNSSLIFSDVSASEQMVTIRVFDDGVVESAEQLKLNLDGGTYEGDLNEFFLSISDEDIDPLTSGDNLAEVGTGTLEFNRGPFGGFYHDNKTQIIFKADELTALGLGAGPISTLSLNVAEINSTIPYTDFTIGLKNSTQTTPEFEEGFTVVYTNTYTPVVGWNEFTLSSNFQWDGTSDLVVQACFDNTAYTSDDAVFATETNFVSVKYKRQDFQTGCDLDGAIVTSMNRPNIRFLQSIVVPVATTQSATATDYVYADETHYIYDSNGELLAGITQLSGSEVACVDVVISRDGNGIQYPAWMAPNGVSDKAITISSDNPIADFELRLYYLDAELDAWGLNAADLTILKTSGAIGDAVPGNSTIQDLAAVTATEFGGNSSFAFSTVFTGFGTFALTNADLVLPIELLQFTAQRVDDYHLLNWTTASEINNLGFDLERSFDGENFDKIAFIDGAGESLVAVDYLHKDKDLQRQGNYYYRLKQIDLDGKTDYSEVIVLEVKDEKSNFQIYPNPLVDRFTLNAEVPVGTNATLVLHDKSGRQIAVVASDFKVSEQQAFDLSEYQLAEGVYFIQLVSGGEVLFAEQLLVLGN